MKTCKDCGSTKPLSEFYINKASVDKYCRLCKHCEKKQSKERFWSKKEIKLKSMRSYSKTTTGKKKLSEASQRAYLKHKHKWIARAKARNAVKKGVIFKPLECEACKLKKALQGHHEDYSKPLEIIWLCSSCHAEADRLLEQKLAAPTSNTKEM